MKQQSGLSAIDGSLLDGLVFCGLVYDLFDAIKNAPDGIARLRLRTTKLEKRLIEELIPLARYVQARYREGRRIKVRWFSGSQPFDAILWSSGGLVTHGMAARRVVVDAIKRVEAARPRLPFRELFLIENTASYTATTWGDHSKPRRKRREPRPGSTR